MSTPAARVPFTEATRTLLHDTVVDAVENLVRSRGWAATTMADVATAAGVSRQTLYNEFGSRPALVQAYVEREINRLIDQVCAAVRADADDAHRALRRAFSLFLELASDEPVVQIITADADGGELHGLLTGVGRQLGGETLAALIPEVWPQVGTDDAQMLADALVRLAISHALAPSEAPDAVADHVERMLAPFVDQLLAGGRGPVVRP